MMIEILGVGQKGERESGNQGELDRLENAEEESISLSISWYCGYYKALVTCHFFFLNTVFFYNIQ